MRLEWKELLWENGPFLKYLVRAIAIDAVIDAYNPDPIVCKHFNGFILIMMEWLEAMQSFIHVKKYELKLNCSFIRINYSTIQESRRGGSLNRATS